MSDQNNKTPDDLKKERERKLVKGIDYMSSCQDWVNNHDALRIYAETVASAAHGHFTKQQLESVNGFFQTFCNRFGCLTLRMVETMVFSAEYVERQPNCTEEDKQLCQQTRDLCIQRLKQYSPHRDKDYYSIIVKQVIPYVKDQKTRDILCAKANLNTSVSGKNEILTNKTPVECDYFEGVGLEPVFERVVNLQTIENYKARGEIVNALLDDYFVTPALAKIACAVSIKDEKNRKIALSSIQKSSNYADLKRVERALDDKGYMYESTATIVDWRYVKEKYKYKYRSNKPEHPKKAEQLKKREKSDRSWLRMYYFERG